MTEPARTCQNIAPGQTEPCGQPWDGLRAGGGSDLCASCRAEVHAIGDAVVALIVERAAALAADTNAA